jgi:1,5-anhydro-D-fructose reductase (1,5-anhydro-D-mannitol-forming)
VTRLGFGIVGCGGAAADMARAIAQLPETYVAGVHDRIELRAAEFAAASETRAHGSLEALIADPAVDVLYVALPHHLLAPTAEAALEAGKHALVEKPLALDVDDVRALERLADARGLLVAPVFELRTSAVGREAHRLVAGGAIGDVTAVRIRTVIDKPAAYWQSGPRGLVSDSWRALRAEAGGGVVLMNSIHQLDLVRYVTGLSFVRVAAEVATLHADVEVEDSAAAVLRLSNGGVASLVAAAHSPGAVGEEEIEIDGTEGRIDLPDLSSGNAAAVRVFLRRPWEQLGAGRREVVRVGRTDTYLELLRAFARAIEDGTPPAATIDDAASALATVKAIYASARSAVPADVVAD